MRGSTKVSQEAVGSLRECPSPVNKGTDSWSAQLVQPIRVCYMIDRLANAGTELQLLSLIRHFDRQIVEPHLVLLDGLDPVSRALEPTDCPVTRLGIRRLRNPKTIRQAYKLATYLHKNRINIFQPHFRDSTYLGVPVARLSDVERVVLTRRDNGYWQTGLDRPLGWLMSQLADVVLANSAEAARIVGDDYHMDPRRISVIPNGIDLDRFLDLPLPTKRVRSSEMTVGIVANLRPVKAPEVFVNAAAMIATRYKNVSFCLAGDGEMRPGLERLASDLGIAGRLSFLGKVTQVREFLGQLDVAVLCSHSEGLSNALLEYMASGRPIVATRVGGNSSLIEDRVSGILVPPRDPVCLAGAIEELLIDRSLAQRLGKAARQSAKQYYDIKSRADEHAKFYYQLLSRPSSNGTRSLSMLESSPSPTSQSR